jgi:hypothetical protein
MKQNSLTKFIICLVLICTSCTPISSPTEEALVVAVRQLATVDIPPTPDRAEREATRRALPTTPTAVPPTATPTNTPYIGVFLGTPGDEGTAAPVAEVVIAPTENTSGECPIAFDPAFGEGWRSNVAIARRIGCPLQERFGFAGNVQVFERGVMYHRVDTNEVWAIQPGNIGTGQYWYVNQSAPMPMEGLIPPPGLRAPGSVFGSAWLTNNEISTGLGYGTTPEQAADLNVQRFDGGSLLLDVTVGQVFLLFDDGDAFGPY